MDTKDHCADRASWGQLEALALSPCTTEVDQPVFM
jgi:hypothetical protein